MPLQPKLPLQVPGAAHRCCPRILPAAAWDPAPLPLGMGFQSTLWPGSAHSNKLALFRGDFFPRQCRNAELCQLEEPSSPSVAMGGLPGIFLINIFSISLKPHILGWFPPPPLIPFVSPPPLFFLSPPWRTSFGFRRDPTEGYSPGIPAILSHSLSVPRAGFN